MISVITAVYNQLAMNQLFWESLKKYTYHPFELIVIDNGSTDGSAEFFEGVGAEVIRNNGNYSYPYSQNQGIKAAQYEYLAFLNNDIIVSPNWDLHLIQNMAANNLEVASSCGIEHLENRKATRYLKRRWNKIKGVLSLFGNNKLVLSLMHKLMYLNWGRFCERRYNTFKFQIKPGFVGNTVVIKSSALAKIGLWDEKIQAGDFDLYLRTLERAQKYKDIKPMHICLDTFNHHYIRLTLKTKYPPFKDKANLIKIEDKWSQEMLAHFQGMND